MTRLRDLATVVLACGIGYGVGLCLRVAAVGFVRLSHVLHR